MGDLLDISFLTDGTLIALLQNHAFLTITISVFLLGEYAIVAAVMFARAGDIGFTETILASTVGTLAADVFWFAVGRYFPARVIPRKLQRLFFTPASRTLAGLIKGRHTLILFLLRFLIGLRLVVILHLSRSSLSWSSFLLNNLYGTVFYLLILVVVGLQLSDLAATLVPAYKTAVSIISGILILFVGSKIIEHVLLQKGKLVASK